MSDCRFRFKKAEDSIGRLNSCISMNDGVTGINVEMKHV